MKDVNIEIKQDDGGVLVVNTDMIEEDVIRSMCGLKPKEQDFKRGKIIIKKINNNAQYAITMIIMVLLFYVFAFWVKSW